MSNIGQTIHALPDLFCKIYDEADHHAFRREGSAWLGDEALARLSGNVEEGAVQGTLSEAFVEALCTADEHSEAKRFAAMRGLDRAFAHVNPLTAAPGGAPPALGALAIWVAARSRLDSGASGGALIVRVVRPSRDGRLSGELRDAFGSVVRVSPYSWDACALGGMPEQTLLHRHELQKGLRIACAPLIADPEEVAFETNERDGTRFYRIRPCGLEITSKRVGHVLDAMIAAEVSIGVAPELTLNDDLLEAWKQALAERRGCIGKLRWLLVGSGDVGHPKPSNVAVLLNARSGEELTRQSKIFPFNFTNETLRRWKLEERLGEGPIDEDLQPGERLELLEGGGVRLAILVCEDLKHVIDLAVHMRSFGVSHILAPVFGRPIKNHRWEQARANVYTDTGATVVVSNSRVMHTILDTEGATGLVVWPGGAQTLHADDAAAVACFTLAMDGKATLD